ncbi:hypothetical protein [Desulfogranum mediterraneum]|uniref:hypothetical protein n=1 Tax=Desulfogranum mediterraneum TaxID=160661 RepID=UPI000401BAE5|nr:hypothetical protein [Desulfogranum mediterraneum]
MNDIEQVLSYEIKKEVADRYFGFRKLIEEDIEAYNDQLALSFRHLEHTIGMHLVRLYILLGRPELIHDFFQITGLHDEIFFDPYLMESATLRKRLFQEYATSGFTKRQRFRRLFLRLYQELHQYVESYRFTVEKLISEQDTIAEEIKLFYRNNDLDAIMRFFRGLNRSGHEQAIAPLDQPAGKEEQQLRDKLKLRPPASVESALPILPELPPLKTIKPALLPLIQRSFQLHSDAAIHQFCH